MPPTHPLCNIYLHKAVDSRPSEQGCHVGTRFESSALPVAVQQCRTKTSSLANISGTSPSNARHYSAMGEEAGERSCCSFPCKLGAGLIVLGAMVLVAALCSLAFTTSYFVVFPSGTPLWTGCLVYWVSCVCVRFVESEAHESPFWSFPSSLFLGSLCWWHFIWVHSPWQCQARFK